jgi:hypothetical protein
MPRTKAEILELLQETPCGGFLEYQQLQTLLEQILIEDEDMLYGLFWDDYSRWLVLSEQERRQSNPYFNPSL